LREVAERVSVNAAAIVRFAQSLGYEGYTEFIGSTLAFVCSESARKAHATVAHKMRLLKLDGLAVNA
jgi:DNA-binding MurR/RpiR family transcriptional regulator